jgi:nicotinate phosphoribosyltransferase
MGLLGTLYRPSLSLLTDLYQITMAYGYWKNGMAEHEAVFHLFFRKTPFKGGYAIAAGLEQAVELIESFRFTEEDCSYLASLTGNDGLPLFETGFLDYLEQNPPRIDLDAVPEGTVVFGQEPLLRVRGSLISCQLLETPLLTILNFQTLIATKSSRVCMAAQGDPVLEFGLRRAQGIDGGISASRAAYIGGCSATSNVLAGRLMGIPVKGTHAHSWVMTFPTESEAFAAYADAMPNNCIFLVDTYDTIEGVENAIAVGRRLRSLGHEMVGIRLDSGDLASLSIEARRLLDSAGFPEAKIVASDGLDEHKIRNLKKAGSPIGVWGVGTNLVTAKDQPALGGVYKLAAVRSPGGKWVGRIKLSETPIKVSNPGIQQVRRYRDVDGSFIADLIYDESQPMPRAPSSVSLLPKGARMHFNEQLFHEPLLQPVLREGVRACELPCLIEVRSHAASQLAFLPERHKRLNGHEPFPVGLESGLHRQKMAMLQRNQGDLARKEER